MFYKTEIKAAILSCFFSYKLFKKKLSFIYYLIYNIIGKIYFGEEG